MATTSIKENRTLTGLLYLLFYRIISVSSTRLRLSFKGVNIIEVKVVIIVKEEREHLY